MKQVKIGRILNTHGLKGDLKVDLISRENSQLSVGKSISINNTDFIIAHLNLQAKKTIIRFKGFNNINDIEHLKGHDIFMSRDEFEQCSDDEFYLSDLIGFKMITDSEKELGVIEKFYSNGPQDIAVVKNDLKSIDYPLLDHLIIEIIESEKIIRVQELSLV